MNPPKAQQRPEPHPEGQHEQQRRRVRQAPAQAGGIGGQQQRTAVHRLGAGGIVVEDHNLHGTIVP